MNTKHKEQIAEARRDVLLGMLIIVAILSVHNMSFVDCLNLGVC
jgi:hypothetical protein